MLEDPPSKNLLFSNVSKNDWNDWKWQIKNSITSYEKLKEFGIEFDKEVENLKLPLRITPYYLQLAKQYPVLLKTIIPSINETIISGDESEDPLEEEKSRKTKCLIHKYSDRVLFLSTIFCSTNCRYCTRSRIINDNYAIDKNIWNEGIEYIKNHSEIRDVLISGGDFLTYSDEKIEYLLKEISSIKHVEMIRIGTKIPMVLPQRITNELIDILKKYHPLYISIHCTHPDELTEEVKIACEKLANAGIVLRSQTVLLKDVNDNTNIMKSLLTNLLKLRISPYYLYLCDKIQGSGHFYSPKENGIKIIKELRNNITGYAIPQLIWDTPKGKIPINPDFE